MTYSKNSDFPIPYGKFVPKKKKPTPENVRNTNRRHPWMPAWLQSGIGGKSTAEVAASKTDSPPDVASTKTRLVAWFVSNCNTASRREDFVKELREHVDVDIYGSCGEFDCPRAKEAECLGMLTDHYKFYLSFENSVCRDYVTEKFWRILSETTAVPIVLGGGDYAKDAPPNSLVNVFNFSSPHRLASFLQLLDTHDHLYNEFHSWRRDYDAIFDVAHNDAWCQLCKALNEEDPRPKWYENIDEFWSEENNCVVTNAKDFYQTQGKDG